MINVTSITKTDKPPIEEYKFLADIFTQEYNSYRITYKVQTSKKVFKHSKSDGTKGHYGSHFESLHKLLQHLPDIDQRTFIKAQFHFRGIIAPYQLFDDNAVPFYYNYIDQCNTGTSNSISVEGLCKTLESTKDFILNKCKLWNIDQDLRSYFSHIADNGIPRFTFEFMISEMPPKLLLANCESYRSVYKFLPKDVQHDLPSLSDLKEHTGYYIKYPDLLKMFKILFGTSESIL